jgi:hypothetical protein
MDQETIPTIFSFEISLYCEKPLEIEYAWKHEP